MYIQIKDEKISLDFNQNISVSINGPDSFYYVEVREYKKNEDQSLFVFGGHISNNNPFILPIEFYMDFEILIYKFVDGLGLQKILNHRYNDFGKLVLFNLISQNYDECSLWVERIKKYKLIHGCNIMIKSNFDELNKEFDSFYQTYGLNFYKTYNIGRIPKSSNDFRTRDPRKENVIWYGNWKTFWSYQHPKPFKNLTTAQIIEDILGL